MPFFHLGTHFNFLSAQYLGIGLDLDSKSAVRSVWHEGYRMLVPELGDIHSII